MAAIRFRFEMLAIACLWPLLSLCASAQTEFLPEVDLYYKLHPDIGINVQTKETVEGGDPVTAEIGASIYFYLKPLAGLKKLEEFDPDDSKSRPGTFAIGYRYLPYPDSTPENRLEPVVTLNFPLKRFLLSDRNRADLDWQNGAFAWRYRNRVQIEKRITIHSYHPAPYVSSEFFYESQYKKWSTTALYAGCLFPIGKHVQLDPYYEHQNNTGSSPNQQLNQGGFVVNLFF